jgi:hypothetical protein
MSDKHVSTEIDSWKPTRYGSRFLGYENEICFHGDRFLETNTSLWDQLTFLWILLWYIRGCSDQNEVSHSSDQNRETRMEPVRLEQVLGSHLLLVIVSYCDYE